MSSTKAIAQIAREALDCLDPFFAHLPAYSSFDKTIKLELEQLHLSDPAPLDFAQMGCTRDIARHLEHIYYKGCAEIASARQQTFHRTICTLRDRFGIDASLADMETALRLRLCADYRDECTLLKSAMCREVQAALDHAATTLAAQNTVLFAFPPDVLAILQRAFDRCNVITKAERLQLARATGLDDRQIATWFANQRQKKVKQARKQGAEMRLSAAPYARTSRAPRRDFSGSSASSSSSLASDASSAPSSIMSWISSSASSGIEYEMQPSPPREHTPLVIQPTEQVFQQSRPVSYGEHYFSQPSYRLAAQAEPQSNPHFDTATAVHEVPSFSVTVPTPSRDSFTPARIIPVRHSLDPGPTEDSQAHEQAHFTSPHFAQLAAPPTFSPPPMLNGFDFEAAANGAQDEHDAAFWSYFLQPQSQGGVGGDDGLVGEWQGGESLMLPIEDIPVDMNEELDQQQWTQVV